MKQIHPGRKLALSVLLLIVLLFLFIRGLGAISARSDEELLYGEWVLSGKSGLSSSELSDSL